LATPSDSLKLAEEIRAVGVWTEELEAERLALEEQLKIDPKAEALALRRIETALTTTADSLAELLESLGDEAVRSARQLIVRTVDAAEAMRLAADEGFRNEPVGTTEQGPWRAMYQAARVFAVGAGLRAADDEFLEGDLCPMCQEPLSADAVARLKRFDLFIADRVTAAASELNAELTQLSDCLERLAISTADVATQTLAEFVSRGEDERLLCDKVVQAYRKQPFHLRRPLIRRPRSAREKRRPGSLRMQNSHRSFWQDVGLSGTAQSMASPLLEMHDATTASGGGRLSSAAAACSRR
jgi:ElaB/YqjD/DUF883 family membrane-anchored ribosome-binding protein